MDRSINEQAARAILSGDLFKTSLVSFKIHFHCFSAIHMCSMPVVYITVT